MRSRNRSARDGGTWLALYFRGENVPTPRRRAHRSHDPLLGAVRIAQTSASDAGGLLGPGLDLRRPFSRGLEERRGRPEPVRRRLPVERASPRRRARGSPVAAATPDPNVSRRSGPAILRRRERRETGSRPARGDPRPLRHARPVRERPLRFPAPREVPRGRLRPAPDRHGPRRRAAPGRRKGPGDPPPGTGRSLDAPVRDPSRVDVGLGVRGSLRGNRGAGRPGRRAPGLSAQCAEEHPGTGRAHAAGRRGPRFRRRRPGGPLRPGGPRQSSLPERGRRPVRRRQRPIGDRSRQPSVHGLWRCLVRF